MFSMDLNDIPRVNAEVHNPPFGNSQTKPGCDQVVFYFE